MKKSLKIAKSKNGKEPAPLIGSNEKKGLLILGFFAALVIISVIVISHAKPGTRLWDIGWEAGIITTYEDCEDERQGC